MYSAIFICLPMSWKLVLYTNLVRNMEIMRAHPYIVLHYYHLQYKYIRFLLLSAQYSIKSWLVSIVSKCLGLCWPQRPHLLRGIWWAWPSWPRSCSPCPWHPSHETILCFEAQYWRTLSLNWYFEAHNWTRLFKQYRFGFLWQVRFHLVYWWWYKRWEAPIVHLEKHICQDIWAGGWGAQATFRNWLHL